jgi:hypothetical protein
VSRHIRCGFHVGGLCFHVAGNPRATDLSLGDEDNANFGTDYNTHDVLTPVACNI